MINPAYQQAISISTAPNICRIARAATASRPSRAAPNIMPSRSAQQTTTDLTPQQIHDIGLREVARIRAEMDAVAREAGYPSREAYIQELRTNPRYYADQRPSS